MTYPTAIQESLNKVNASRAVRLGETHPRLSPAERDELLRTFHPDYIGEAFRELRLGPNKGDRAPHELVDILEAPAAIPSDFDVSPMKSAMCSSLAGVGREPARRCWRKRMEPACC
jgi:hypothetical protein